MGEPRVLVVGQGGREHALADVLHNSAEHPRVYVAPGSPGMQPVAADRRPAQPGVRLNRCVGSQGIEPHRTAGIAPTAGEQARLERQQAERVRGLHRHALAGFGVEA